MARNEAGSIGSLKRTRKIESGWMPFVACTGGTVWTKHSGGSPCASSHGERCTAGPVPTPAGSPERRRATPLDVPPVGGRPPTICRTAPGRIKRSRPSAARAQFGLSNVIEKS